MNWKRFIIQLAVYAAFLTICNDLPREFGFPLFVVYSAVATIGYFAMTSRKGTTCLIIFALLNATTFAWTPPNAIMPPITDEAVTVYDITAYSATNAALHDYTGAPYTKQFFFTLQTSTNLAEWQDSCTVTGWCNADNMLIAAYTNGALAAASYGPITTGPSPPGPQFFDKCIVALIVIGLGVYVAIQLKKMCDRCLPPPATPVSPPATNQVHQTSCVTLPQIPGDDKQRFYRVAQ
jgi:hypothetical protein